MMRVSIVRLILAGGALLALADPSWCGPPGSGARFTVGRPASWVDLVEADIPTSTPSGQLEGGVYFLLTDRQVRVDATGPASYVHVARRIVNDAGLANASQISVVFDPSYQRLAIHTVRVLRSGQWSNRLDASRVQVLQREPELESQIYDGRVTAVLFVEDVRVGDVVDYSFTLAGSNPVFAGQYFDMMTTEWSVPLHRMRFRLLWPQNRTLFVRNHRTTLAPVTRELGLFTESVWERQDPLPITADSGVPAWYDAYGWIQLSEAETWSAVAEWGRRQFEIPTPLAPELAAHVSAWRHLPVEEGTLAALRFVQDEVRYLGIEMGTGSHKPSPPDVVFNRRFGDCKDKALLLCALLRELGVEARPALVHASAGLALDEWQPSPNAFNHVVVRLRNGHRWQWVDPTLTAQGGTLAKVSFPDYRRALLLEPGTASLSVIPVERLARPSTAVNEAFDVTDLAAAVRYTVVTRYEDRDADHTRYSFRTRSPDEVTQSYLKYYSRIWPGISSTGPVQFSDDRDANVLTTTESYTIPKFWATQGGKGRQEVELWPSGVEGVLPNPARTNRWGPLGLPFPLKVRHSTSVSLPEDWDVPAETTNIADGTVRFGFRSTRQGRKVVIDYEYETLAGDVAAVDFPAHLQTIDKVRDRLGFRLRRPLVSATAGARTSGIVLSVVFGTATMAVLSTVLLYRHRSPRLVAARGRAPSMAGRRGWLLVFGLFVALRLFGDARALWATHANWTVARWMEHTTPGADDYQPYWGPLLLAEVSSNIVLLAGGALLLALFLGRRGTLPIVYAGLVVARALLFLGVALLAQRVPGHHEAVSTHFLHALGVFGAACLWIAYLFRSDRVRSTLVR